MLCTSLFGLKTRNIANSISAAIEERVTEAIRAREPFRVIIMVPCHSDGALESKITQTLLRYMQLSLTQGRKSLIFQIQQEIDRVNATGEFKNDRYAMLFLL